MSDIVMPTVPAMRRRVVLEHTCGPHKGLMQIMGTTDDIDGAQPPAVTDEFEISPWKRRGVAGLVRSNARFVLYREITAPEGLGTFDRRQR